MAGICERGERSVPDFLFDPERLDRLPVLQNYFFADELMTWSVVAERFYDLKGEPAKRAESVIDALRAANPNLREVNAGDAVAIPVVPGVSPLRSDVLARPPQALRLAAITVPELPVTDQPPDNAPLVSPPFHDPGEKIGIEQAFRDTIHPDCTYLHAFFLRRGPIQTREFQMGTVVWVKFLANLTTALGPVGVTGLSAQYAVYEAPRIVVRTWQWQEIWDVCQKICVRPISPSVEVRVVAVSGSGKWVRLPDREVRGQPMKEIHSDYGANADSRCKAWADKYQKSDPATVVRGPDEI
jgi:hypothetical protein